MTGSRDCQMKGNDNNKTKQKKIKNRVWKSFCSQFICFAEKKMKRNFPFYDDKWVVVVADDEEDDDVDVDDDQTKI